jgi:hypothetical protein
MDRFDLNQLAEDFFGPASSGEKCDSHRRGGRDVYTPCIALTTISLCEISDFTNS